MAASLLRILTDRSNPLVVLIVRACHPSQPEPNLALNLEVCDFINEKKKNFPHDAAFTLAELVNSRNPAVSSLALTLLDNCMKNCGHTFQLHVATKDFLNEFVRKFPEHPPMNISTIQRRILEMLQEWRMTLCRHSRYKDDLRSIEDMVRLLEFKGYMMPTVNVDRSALMPSQTLKSADQLEEEDQAARAAKLQELIRKGTPSAIREANELMKIMTGYEKSGQPDYQQEVTSALDTIEAQVMKANDFINSLDPADERQQRAKLESILRECRSAQAKIQKMITDNEDDENTERLLLLNDTILEVIGKYDLLRRGIAPRTAAQAAETTRSPPVEEASLIDMGNDAVQGRSVVSWGAASGATAPAASADTATPPAGQGPSVDSIMNDLLGLNFSSPTARTASPAIGPISLPSTGTPNMPTSSSVLQQPLIALPNSNATASTSVLSPVPVVRPSEVTATITANPDSKQHKSSNDDPFSGLIDATWSSTSAARKH